MEYKTVQFEVLQTNPSFWEWIVFVDAAGLRAGVSLARADAGLDAESAIDEALECKKGQCGTF